MRRLAFAFLLMSLPLTAWSCGCRLASDCEFGERCVRETGECIKGCESNEDCSEASVCQLDIGRCVPRGVRIPPLLDSGVGTSTLSDAGTSTVSDAGAADTGMADTGAPD